MKGKAILCCVFFTISWFILENYHMQKTPTVLFAKQETKETFCPNAFTDNVYLIFMFQGLKSWFISRIVFLQPGN